MKKCLFAGSFDPITNGHEELIKKASEMFEEVYVVLSLNLRKKSMFSEEDRVKMISAVCAKYKNVKIATHRGIIADFMKDNGIRYFVRGLRNTTDYVYENEMTYFNSVLLPEMVTVYLPCSEKNVHVSSSAVRELMEFHKDVTAYVPQEILPFIEKFKKTV